MIIFGRKKQINLQKGTKLGLLKKRQLPKRKLPFLIIGLIVACIILLGFWGTSKFEGARKDRLQSNVLEEQLQEQAADTTGTVDEPDNAIVQSPSETPTKPENANSSNASQDLFIGPVRLSDSSYIKDQLDDFASEQSSTHTTSDDDLNTDNSSTLEDILTHPFNYLSSLGYSIRASVMNNGKRTTLLKLVDSVSRYYVSYSRFPTVSSSVEDSYDWISQMVEANEMSGTYEYVLRTTSPSAYCGSVQQNGYCYNSDEKNAILYVRIEETDKDICGDQALFLLWSSQDNKMGELCMDQEPTALSGFQFLPIQH